MSSTVQIWLAAAMAVKADRAMGSGWLPQHEGATPMSQGFLFDPGLPNALRQIRLLKQFLELRPVTKNGSMAATTEPQDSVTDIHKDEQANG